MEEVSRAILKRVRVSPQKARLVANVIRGMGAEAALVQLRMQTMKAAHSLYKTLRSAVANAENNMMADRADLRVIEVRVDEGPTYKRSTPANKGRRHPIKKRTSHFTVVVGR